MRTREDIEKDSKIDINYYNGNTGENTLLEGRVPLKIELLLDIRDLLAKPK